MTLGDRIVIMKDGFIQQIGTPQEVFDHPANLFAADFIGTPQMNFFDAELQREGDRYSVILGGIKVELSLEKSADLTKKGISGQLLHWCPANHIMLGKGEGGYILAKVDVFEMIG